MRKRLQTLLQLIWFMGFMLLLGLLSMAVVGQPFAPATVLNQDDGEQDWHIYLPFVVRTDPLVITPKGLAAPFGTVSCEDAERVDAGWYYNWLIHPDSGCPLTARFVPRMWGAADVENLEQAVANAQPSGWMIGFNEPNLPWQANLTPEQGADLWRQIEAVARPAGIKLVSPAPNQDQPGKWEGDNYGNQWTWAMVEAYANKYGSNPHFDAIGWHIYDPNPETMKQYLMARRDEGRARGYGEDVKIWVLEYNGCFVQDEPRTVMEEMTTWFEAQDWIDRYAWYLSRRDPANPDGNNPNCMLIDDENNLTEIGQIYQNLP